jgi:hypothetical protein
MNEGTWKYFWANRVSIWGKQTFDFGQQAFNFGQTVFFILGTHVWNYWQKSFQFWANRLSILGKQVASFGADKPLSWGRQVLNFRHTRF